MYLNQTNPSPIQVTSGHVHSILFYELYWYIRKRQVYVIQDNKMTGYEKKLFVALH